VGNLRTIATGLRGSLHSMRICKFLFGIVTTIVVFTSFEIRANAQTRTMPGETVALYGTETKQLLYPIEKIKVVYSYDTNGRRIDYKEGIDYVKEGTGIRRVSGSAIYDFNNYVVTYKPDGKFTWIDTPRNPPFVNFLQVFVDYTAIMPVITIPALAQAPITRRILLAADGIGLAANTISLDAFKTDADGFIGLIRKYFKMQVSVGSFTVVGSSLTVLQQQLPTILADPPGLLIIAFGMNDHSELNQPTDLNTFQAKLTQVVSDTLDAGTKVIIVGFPAENPLWENFSLERTLAYNGVEARVAEKFGVPFVDIYAAFEQVKMKKELVDFFGDNYHHPGNFGQRIYFSNILPFLLTTPISSADVPEFVVLPGY
jgi:lysophospholipase L1-like esterase